jgi:hypothetical protein
LLIGTNDLSTDEFPYPILPSFSFLISSESYTSNTLIFFLALNSSRLFFIAKALLFEVEAHYSSALDYASLD